MFKTKLTTTGWMRIGILAALAPLALASAATAGGPPIGVLVDPWAGTEKAVPALEGVEPVRSWPAADYELDVDPGIEIVALTAAGFRRAPAEALRRHYEAGRTVAVIDGQVSLLARALGVETDLPDLRPTRLDGPVESIALLMPLFDELGNPVGYHAFTDFIDGAPGVRRVLAQVARVAPPRTASVLPKSGCSGITDTADNTSFIGPAGVAVVGYTTTHCTWDSINSRYAIFGYGYTASNAHDELKITMVTYNNCGYWHQISSTVKTGTGNVGPTWPGITAGIPSCGNKFLTNSVHSARQGSTWYSDFTSACAGSGC